MKSGLPKSQVEFLAAVASNYSRNGELPTYISIEQINSLLHVQPNLTRPDWLMTKRNKTSRNLFMIPEELWQKAGLQAPTPTAPGTLDVVSEFPDYTEYIPPQDPQYVPEGAYFNLVKLFRSRRWIPMWIDGPTGGGKTMAVENACHAAGREFFRVQLTVESDEAALLGTYHLKNGETEFVESRIIQAMTRGGVLLLDECDQARERAMCIQPVLEGKSVFLTRANKLIVPAPGFQCVATGNTKGQGDDTGQYTGTNIINEAFLDRISAMSMTQDYPCAVNERNILKRTMADCGIMDEQFVFQLVEWANKCRENHKLGVIQNTISTRKLVRIVEAYSVFEDREEVMKMALNRFDPVSRGAMDQYFKMFDGVTDPQPSQTMTW